MASRKSARITAKVEAVATAEGKLTTKAQGSRALKKQKISSKKEELNDNAIADQSNHNMNSKFTKDIPFDILLEIFSLLEPIDWLHLSRVSKSLHGLLTSNDLSSLWKLAYKNIEQDYRPPLCPNDTNVVCYTNYLYGRHCQFCSSRSRQIYHESAFIRLCSKCAGTSLRLDASQVDPAVRHLCNKWTFPEYQEGGQMILNAEYTLRLKEFEQAQKEGRRQSYFAERDRAVLERASLASHIARWRKNMQTIQHYKLKAIHDRRIACMRKNLEEEGYKADSKGPWHSIPHVRKSHGLTDSEWSFIRADVLDFLQNRREKRALTAIQTKLQNRVAQLEEFISQWKIRPTAWWIASSEPIASFMKSDQRRIRKEDFKKVEPQLHTLVTSWKRETDHYLAALLPQPSGKGKKKDTRNSKTSPLELATNFFKCDSCTEPISYPRILMHSCLVEDQDEEENEEEDACDREDFEEDVVTDARGPRVPRPPKKITVDTVFPTLSDCYSTGMCAGKEGIAYHEEASNAARYIIMACGQDPMTVTYAEMEEIQTRLECLRCSRATQAKQKAKSVRLVMKWLTAIVHDLEEHSGDLPSSEPSWGRICSSEDLAKVRDAEINIKKLRKYKTPMSCKHCSWFGVTQEQQSDHMISQHKILVNEDTVSQQFSPQLDASIKTMHPAVKI